MTLKINLVPGECVVIGKARVENGGDHRCTLIIQGEEVILRGRRVLRERDATTPMKRLYFVVQCIYLAEDKAVLTDLFFQVCREGIAAWPEFGTNIADIGELIQAQRYYEALNQTHALVEREQKLLAPRPEQRAE